jgi:hypothetical protein
LSPPPTAKPPATRVNVCASLPIGVTLPAVKLSSGAGLDRDQRRTAPSVVNRVAVVSFCVSDDRTPRRGHSCNKGIKRQLLVQG